ncbi:IncP plasmid survival protein KfrC family protein [Pseudomonas nitroreducens]|uniref:IncP plasmid survival protein KfrC family protein n=1 Tax=Pseudomonas nitroreducens TaxID=46680 RepID=UPI003CC81D76
MKQSFSTSGAPSNESGQALEAQVQSLAGEQSALLESASVQARYDRALNECVEQKAEQAGALEQRLEELIGRQLTQLQQSQAMRPGWLARPSIRAAWQEQNERCHSRLLDLQGRLERVQDLHHGMGLYTPRLDELAARRLRAEQPELAQEWSLQRQAVRVLEESQRRGNGLQPGMGTRTQSSSP